jgi:cardiolipin synthase
MRMVWLVVILLLFIFQTATILISEFKRPSKAVAWLMVLFILPIIGFIMYYFLAKEYSRRKRVRRKGNNSLEELQRRAMRKAQMFDDRDKANQAEIYRESRLFGLLHNIPGAPITGNNRIQVLTNAQAAYPAMLEAIEQAKLHIHFEFYTIRNDKIGTVFQEALLRRVEAGIKVRIIYDGIGSYTLSSEYVRKLKAAGAEVYAFLPPFFAFFDKRMNYRNHRKIVVVDGRIGFLGGINIGDEYLGANSKLGFWRDTHLQMQGDAVYVLQNTFLRDWTFVSKQRLRDTDLFPDNNEPHASMAQIISSGPDAHWDSILEMFFAGAAVAQRRIYITTPYFIPDPSITMALKTAAISGVDVRIILPYKADSAMVHYASLSYLQELMQAGVRFYLYRKGFIHAKVMLVDQLLATVGSANMDMRSFFSNFELNAVLFHRKEIERLDLDFAQDMLDSEELKLEEFEKRSRWEKAKEVLARLLSPLF